MKTNRFQIAIAIMFLMSVLPFSASAAILCPREFVCTPIQSPGAVAATSTAPSPAISRAQALSDFDAFFKANSKGASAREIANERLIVQFLLQEIYK